MGTLIKSTSGDMREIGSNQEILRSKSSLLQFLKSNKNKLNNVYVSYDDAGETAALFFRNGSFDSISIRNDLTVEVYGKLFDLDEYNINKAIDLAKKHGIYDSAFVKDFYSWLSIVYLGRINSYIKNYDFLRDVVLGNRTDITDEMKDEIAGLFIAADTLHNCFSHAVEEYLTIQY